MKKTNKFKVIPGLSLTGKELMARLENNSIIIASDGKTYDTTDHFEEMKRKRRVELHRDYVKGITEITELKNKLQQINENNNQKIKASQTPTTNG